ncbi:hypothetical protein [Nocardiopsis sp. NPDC006832]|uniref:hypothetical protein n=1 Tax=Nocardiopsis sp. NPDC006832 TaxID=3157188 RepID=UPI00340D3CF0
MNFTHNLWAKASTMVMPQESEHKDKGAGFVEYGAIIVFVGIVAAVLYSSNIGTLIIQGITSAISRVFTVE